MCACSPKGQPSPGLHPQQRGQQGKGGDSALLEPSAQDRPGPVGVGPEEAPAMI